MKERLDVILVSEGYAVSREKAKAIIMAGNVFVDGQREDKAGSMFDTDKVKIEVRGATLKYVSRGGLKLEKALKQFDLSMEGRICMDIGASTGGFTDCMLQNGAVKVYAVDVGHGQLAWKLRNDERVVCMEKTNFRHMVPGDIADLLDFASVDVSFISLTKILLPARALLRDGGEMVCLIKPQFEAGRDKVGKKGVVREKSVHREVIEKVITYADMLGFLVKDLEYSPIKGPEGNIEYLVFLEINKSFGERKCISPEDTTDSENVTMFAPYTEKEAEDALKELLETKEGLAFTTKWQEKITDTVNCAHGELDKE